MFIPVQLCIVLALSDKFKADNPVVEVIAISEIALMSSFISEYSFTLFKMSIYFLTTYDLPEPAGPDKNTLSPLNI